MKKKTERRLIAVLCIVFLMTGPLFLTSCSGKPGDGRTKSEGTKTDCEVSYSAYNGSFRNMFLKEGDRIAVISPSSTPTEKQVDAAVNGLKNWGYVPVKGKHVCEEIRTLDDCLEDLTWALEDPSIKAVFCVRGGYGASEVMDEVPMELIASSGKLMIGYSDISVYHSAWTRAGLPSVHASMAAAFTDLPKDCRDAQEHLLKGEIPSYNCESSSFCREGEAEGVLIGGNLSTVTSVLGTAYDCTEIDQPYILFFEDVEEDLQHIHRYLTVLKHQGVLDGAAGVIFGEWTDMPLDPNDYAGDSRGGEFRSVADMITREFLKDTGIPVAFGFPAGHGEANYPLLLGTDARLCVSKDRFTLEWPD